MRVLLVDDSKDILDLVGFIIEKQGCEVVCASSGQQALEIIDNKKFDLIFLDVKMPEMDGIETLKAIRQRGYSTPVVILTAFGDENIMKETEDLGIAGFVHKGKEVGFISESVIALIRKFQSKEEQK